MFWKALGGAVIAAVALIAGCTTISIVASGCRLFSVGQDEFVPANRVVLDDLPVFPGATRVRSSSQGWAATNKCIPSESGPPYDRFQTSDVFTLPRDGERLDIASWDAFDSQGRPAGRARVPAVQTYYDRLLAQSGWRLSHWSGPQVWYRRDDALLCVSAYTDRHEYVLDVVHDL